MSEPMPSLCVVSISFERLLEVPICLRSIESSLGTIGIYLLRIQRTIPKEIVSKFCFFVSKCGQQVDFKGTIRDSYLFEVDGIFSFLLGRRNGAFWAVLIQFVKDDDDLGRISGSKFESSEERY